MLRYIVTLVPFKEWGEDFAKEHELSIDAVRQDYYRRDRWIPELLKLENVTAMIDELVASMDESRREAWRLYHTTENPYIKIAALKHVAQVSSGQVNVLAKTGRVKPEEAKQEIVLRLWEKNKDGSKDSSND